LRTWCGGGSGSGYRAVLFVCLFLSLTTRLLAQSSSSQWEGTVFTPALERVPGNGTSVFLPTLRLEGTDDSNLLSSQTGQLSSAYILVEGEGKYSLKLPEDTLLVTYSGGGRFYPQYSNLNSSIQDGRLQWQYDITKKTKFTVTGRWASLPEGTVLEGNPNEVFSFIGSNVFNGSFLEQRVEIRKGTASYEYAPSKHVSIIVGGNYDLTKLQGLGLINTIEEDAYGGINYRPTPRQTLGLMYANQWLYFSKGLPSSQVENLILTYTNKITHNFSINAFAGPAQVTTQSGSAGGASTTINLPTGGRTTLISKEQGGIGGGVAEATFGHNKLRAEYTRMVTGGSGFLTTVLRQTSDLTASRSVTRKIELSVVGAYTSNVLVGSVSSGFRTFYVEPAMHYDLTPRLRLSLRDSVGQVLGLAQIGAITRNQMTVQIEYKFQQIPLGK